jgi:hypothetical protein
MVNHWVKKSKNPSIYGWSQFCNYGALTRVVISFFWLADEAANRTELKDKIQTKHVVIAPQMR